MESTVIPHIMLRGIAKRFGGTAVLSHVDLDIASGTVHGLIGENGAGKSTLGKIIAGVHGHDDGTMRIRGKLKRYATPREALLDGLTLIAQELALEPHRTVMENVFLGSEISRFGILNRRAMERKYAQLSQRTGFNLRPDETVGTMRTADQQKVEILRALARDAELIVMDEPTAALTVDETENLFAAIHRLGDQGTTVVYVSHHLPDVLNLTSRVTVLRDGELVKTVETESTSVDELVTAMLGRPLSVLFPPQKPPAKDACEVLRVDGLETDDVTGISFSVREGEIVGLAGLVGSGRSELARAIFGADSRNAGTIRIDGQVARIHSPRHAMAAGIALVPESRKESGLNLGRPILHNVTLAGLAGVSLGGVIKKNREKSVGRKFLDIVKVPPRLSAPVSSLSGGNQQRVLFAKWLLTKPRILFVDEPTRGVDIAASQAIHELIVSLAAEGVGIVVISSEHEEVLGLAHRVLVLREGRVVAELEGKIANEKQLLAYALGRDQGVVA